jgi:phosphatidylglycerol:prolipoprotein diacylglycerol transferase
MIALFRSLLAPPRHVILLFAALWIGLTLAEKRLERHNISKAELNNIVFYGIVGYILGGRLLYALENLSIFARSPLSIFSPNIDLFDPFAAIVTTIIVGLIYGNRKGLPLWSALDAFTPLFAILAIGMSLSHLAANEIFGTPTNVPWGMEHLDEIRHPVQFYELIASILIFGWIWLRKTDPRAGMYFLSFAALTAAARLFLESFRGDSTLIFGGLRLTQVIAWMVLALGFIAIELLRRNDQIARWR